MGHWQHHNLNLEMVDSWVFHPLCPISVYMKIVLKETLVILTAVWLLHCNSYHLISSSWYIDISGLVQERCNSIANALELRLSCTYPSNTFDTVIPSHLQLYFIYAIICFVTAPTTSEERHLLSRRRHPDDSKSMHNLKCWHHWTTTVLAKYLIIWHNLNHIFVFLLEICSNQYVSTLPVVSVRCVNDTYCYRSKLTNTQP